MTEDQKSDRIRQLRALVKDAPRIRATFKDVDAEFKKTREHFEAVRERHVELSSQLASIASARVELGLPDETDTTGEPAPDPTPATKPKKGDK